MLHMQQRSQLMNKPSPTILHDSFMQKQKSVSQSLHFFLRRRMMFVYVVVVFCIDLCNVCSLFALPRVAAVAT